MYMRYWDISSGCFWNFLYILRQTSDLFPFTFLSPVVFVLMLLSLVLQPPHSFLLLHFLPDDSSLSLQAWLQLSTKVLSLKLSILLILCYGVMLTTSIKIVSVRTLKQAVMLGSSGMFSTNFFFRDNSKQLICFFFLLVLVILDSIS